MSSSTIATLPGHDAPPATQKQKKIIDYISHLPIDDTTSIPTTNFQIAIEESVKLGDLTGIRNTPPTSSPSTLSPIDIAEMRSFISLSPLIRGKTWIEIIPLLAKLKTPLTEMVQDLIDYRADLRSEDVEKIGGLEIGILKLEGAMAIMEVMRMVDEDELMVRRALLAAKKARLSVEASTEDEVTKTVVGDGMAKEAVEGAMDLIGNEEPLEDETEVPQTDNQATNDAIVDAIVDIQHEEERAETAEAELQAQLQAQIQRDVGARSRSEEKKTPVETAPTKKVEEVKAKGRSEPRQLRKEKETPAAAASKNDIIASRVSRSLNPMENAKLAVVIPQQNMKGDGTMQMKKEEDVRVEAEVKEEEREDKARKVGDKALPKTQEKRKLRPTEDIRSGVKVKKQKL